MNINIYKLCIITESTLKHYHAEKIRGYFGNLFIENPSAHSHKEDGSFSYKYPCVQYKVSNGSCIIVGFNEGSEIIKTIFQDLKSINIEGTWKEVLNMKLENYFTVFSVSSKKVQYAFITPWLALNESNYNKYVKYGYWQKKKELLEKILIGNIISMSKSLGYTVPETIKPNIIHLKEVQTSLKGNPMLGFLGSFSVNFEIPDYWGIGKSVSRGFGTIIRKT